MSYRVDSKTMLFTDLSDVDAELLQQDVEDLLLLGTSVYNTKAYQAWLEACNENLNPNFGLLMMATVYPTRALLSIVRMQQKRLTEDHCGCL